MIINVKTGLLEDVIFLPTTHCDARPEDTPIDMIVIHSISLPPNEFGTGCVEKFFCGDLDFSQHPYFAGIANLKVSAHLFINRKGEIIQFVPFPKRAWHAGVSYFLGRERCNDFSVGIELEGTENLPYEPIQYQQLALAIKALIKTYPGIDKSRIVGHSDVAPGRKTDPGPSFNWQYLDDLLRD